MSCYEEEAAQQGRLLYPGNLNRVPLLLPSSSTPTSPSLSPQSKERKKRTTKMGRDVMSDRSLPQSSSSSTFFFFSSSSNSIIRGEGGGGGGPKKSSACSKFKSNSSRRSRSSSLRTIASSSSSSSNSTNTAASLPSATSKSTLCLYHLTFLTFMMVTLVFLIITIGASESENEEYESSALSNYTLAHTSNSSTHIHGPPIVLTVEPYSSPSSSSSSAAAPPRKSTTTTTTSTKHTTHSVLLLKVTDNASPTANYQLPNNFHKRIDESNSISSSNHHFSMADQWQRNSKKTFTENDTSNSIVATGDDDDEEPRVVVSGDQVQSDQAGRDGNGGGGDDEEEDWVSRMLRNLSNKRNNTSNDARGKGGSRGSRSVCRISEFSCSRGKCVPGDKYCDGVDDCGDGSDEPRFCTPCNRTYYGEWGSTYSLSLSSETISSILQSHQGGRSSMGSSSSSGSADKSQSSPPSSSSSSPPHFVCQLAFAAAGDNFGDLVQIMFDSINIGQFGSSTVQGCPTGSLQIFEINRPITGGQWCGTGTGYSVYFSEMSAIVLTLTLGGSGGFGSQKGAHAAPSAAGGHQDRIRGNSSHGNDNNNNSNETVQNFSKWTSKGGDTTVITSSQQQTNHIEFDFKIRYKFIPKSLAVVRYGLLNSPIERGVLVPDTYCSRVLDTCHKTRCKIQSPNYPGLYPRNVTCYYTVRQREIPPCKRVLIQVTQMKPHKVQLRSIPGRQLLSSIAGAGGYSVDQSANMDSFLAWEDCRGDRDSLIIYDGTTTNDPVLLKICGGTYIPPITSSGPAILVAFHSTAYGNPLDPKPAAPFPSPLRGFELDVGVVIVDSESADYSNHHNCSFIFISSKEGESPEFQAQEYGGNWITAKSGTVSSPRHTIPLNTTCRYEFRGNKHEAIWVYFVAYRRDLIKDSKEYEGNCTTRLRIWDGIDTRNNALLATYCDNELPKLCDHKALQNETRLVRACTANESYISAGSRLIIEQQFMEGTALRPLHYQFNYEFVRRHAGTDGTCNRHFNLAKMKSHRGIIRTSDNVFDFGRGGRTNLTCIYTFTLPSYESLHLKILNSSFGDRPCNTLTDFETGRFVCNETRGMNDGGVWFGPSASIRLYEEIWTNLNVTSHENCVCGNSSNNPMFFFTFLGRKVHLKFTVEDMKSQDSPENFFVYLEYELKSGGCRGDNHYMRTESGMISLESSFTHGLKEKPPTCEHYPWIIEAREGYSLYLRVPGYTMIDTGNSRSSNRTAYNGTFGAYQPIFSTSFENRMCPTTKNRIFIYDRTNKRTHKICPASNLQQMTKKSGQIVEIFSEDFEQYESPLYPPPPPKFIIEFIGRELGSYRIQWLEVMSAKMKVALLNMERLKTGKTISLDSLSGGEAFILRNGTFPDLTDPTKRLYETTDLISSQQNDRRETIQKEVCESYCPELNACISDKLWCDGEAHCPITLSDEKSCDSFWLTISQLMSPAVYIPVAAAIVSAIVCCGLVILCVFLKRTVLNGHSLKENGEGIRVSSLDRRLERMDPHDPIS